MSGADPGHVAAVLDVLRGRAPRCGGVTVLAVDGPSGAGKSVLATAVAEHLAAPVVGVDELIPGWDGAGQAAPLLAAQVLEPLSRGEVATYRRWDWHAMAYAETVPVPVDDVLVVEGVGCAAAGSAPYLSTLVWVEAPRAVCLERGLARDGETFAPHWERWKAQEDALFAADGTRGRADLVLRTA